MKKSISLLSFFLIISFYGFSQNYGLQSYDQNNSYAGYTLFAMGFEAYLIDNCGFEVHSWNTDNTASLSSYLMPNGNLLWPSKLISNSTFIGGGGGGGRLDIYNSSSQLSWRYDYYSPNSYCAHHDVEPLPNGNILIIAWEEIPASTLINYGRSPTNSTNNFWSERIVEITPVGIGQINTVWEWHMTDHLVQDFDPSKQNFGSVVGSPNKMDINANPTGSDWLHMNGIEYIEEYDQILFSCRHIHEIMVIDHSTTTAQAATGSGGQSGMGGDILWRYGNPANYDRGTAADKVLYGQHDARWTPTSSSSPHAGKISVFNNSGGQNLGAGNTSTADVIDAPVDASGNWTQPVGTSAFYPASADYIFSSGPNGTFSSSNQGGVEPLPNGNLIVCNANQAELFELDINGNVVWEYEVPIPSSVFKVNRYDQSALELSNFTLTPGSTIESPSAPASAGCTVTYPCSIAMSISGMPSSTSSPNAIGLIGSPAGGTFSGAGVIGNTFNPVMAGSGLHDVTYTYTDISGCTDSVVETIFIFTINFNFVSYNSNTISPRESITIEVNADESSELNIQILNLDGKVLSFEQIIVHEGIGNYEVDIERLPQGMYVISASTQKVRSNYKFIKHH